MSKLSLHEESKEQASASEIVMDFMVRFRMPLIIGLSVVIISIIAGFAIQGYRQARLEDSAEIVLELEQAYQDLISADDVDRAQYTERFESAYTRAVEDFAGMYAEMKAHFLNAQFHFEQSDYSTAIDYYTIVNEQFSDSHLAPISLINSAVALEETGNTQAAIEKYEMVINQFGDAAPNTPRAMFALGRIYEDIDMETALNWYERLIESNSGQEWSSLAENRIIRLQNIY